MHELTYVVWAGLIWLHVVALRAAARALGVPVGKVFPRTGAPRTPTFLAALAGPFAHALLVIVLTFAVLKGWGVADEVVVVTSVRPGAPADGRIEPADVLLAADGHAIHDGIELDELTQASHGQPMALRVRRGHAIVEVQVAPVLDDDRYRFGVRLTPAAEGRTVATTHALALAAAAPLALARQAVTEIVGLGRQNIGETVKLVRHSEPTNFVGPVAIVVATRPVGPPMWVVIFGWLARQIAGVGLVLLLFDLIWIFARVRSPKVN